MDIQYLKVNQLTHLYKNYFWSLMNEGVVKNVRMWKKKYMYQNKPYIYFLEKKTINQSKM